MNQITLLIVDDHPLFRQGVVDALSLEPDMKIIAQSATGDDALEMIRTKKPTIALLDVNLPGMNGQQITHQVSQEKIPTRVILMTGYDDVEQAIHAMLAGAQGYCSKDVEPQSLSRIIREVAEGKYVVSSNVFDRRGLDQWIEDRMEGARRSYSEPGAPYHPLSDREMEVLSCVVRGMSNKEIASMLGISHQTVKNHVTAILRKSPHIQVVILSVQGDQNYMRRAMLAGARDFLTKPPMGDELISAIRRAGEMSHLERQKGAQTSMAASVMTGSLTGAPGLAPSTKGKIITVYSPKGGTGCTTIAVNLAIALHNETTRVVIVDGNLQYGDVAVFLNEQGKNTILDLAPRVDELEPDIVEEILIKHEASGIRILAAPQRPEMAEKVGSEQFVKVLQFLQRMFAYVVVDTASILTDVVLGTIDISDIVLLLTTQEIPAIKNARLFLDLLQTMGIDRERIVFTMNRYDRRIAITPERISENLKQEVAAAIPLDEKIVITAVNRGVPFMLDNKTQPAGRGIFSLAEAVRARVATLEAETETPLKR